MTIRDIAVKFGFDVDKNSEKKAESSIRGIKSLATKLLGAIGIGFSIAGISKLAEAAADAEALKSQFTQVFGDMESTAAKKLDKIADDTGVLANRMKSSFTQIAAFAKTTGADAEQALEISDRAMISVADSAAFYDRSIEEVTESMRSFLKGNFAVDASLGLSATETTRNAAANELYSKSFKDLSESEKQFTLLKMVEDANKASGAIGQAARESDTWTNQLGNLKQSLKDMAAAAGAGILKPAVYILRMLTSITQKATQQITKLTGENGFLTRSFNSLFSLVKKLQPAMERMMQSLTSRAAKATNFVKGVVDKLGGAENAFKILAIAAAAFLVVMNWSKITDGARMFIKMLSGIGRMFSFANLKILAIIAIIVLLALVVEDFINFLMGNDSVIGSIFDKAGIGADNARQAIFNAWKKVQEFLLEVWDFIKQAALIFFGAIKDFFVRHSDSIRANFERAWGLIKTFLSGVWTFITQLAATLFGDTEDSINGSTMSTKEKLLAVWQAIVDALSAVWDALYEAASAIFNALAAVIEFIFKAIQAFWDAWGTRILAYFKVVWDNLGKLINGFLGVIKGLANFIKSVFTGDWEGAWNAIKDIFANLWDMIVAILTIVWEKIKLIIEMALAAIKEVWEAVWGAISSFFIGLWNGIVSFFQGIWNAITSTISNAINNAKNTIISIFTAIATFISNTVNGIKDGVTNTFNNIVTGIANIVGRIKETVVQGFTAAIDWIKALPGQALKWGSDMIDGIVNGIKNSISKVTDAVKGVADKIKSFLHFSVPDEGPLTEYESWMPDFMQGLGKGIEGNQDVLLDKVKGVASGISTLMKSATAQAQTVANSTVSNSTSNVTQNNTFNNSYSGSDTQAQANVSKAMNKSTDTATSQLARGLAYAR